ncbi:MAG: type II toxin-antitoxin system RelE/ParE family toxin [Allorhizobium sp.]
MFEDYVYIAKYNPSAADAFVLDIEDKLRSLAQLGLTGSSRGDLRRGLRAISYRQRMLFFTVDDLHLTVLRVLHGHQNITPDDFTESSP